MKQNLQNGLAYLVSQQNNDGSFWGWSSGKKSLQNLHANDTIFFSALMLSALAKVPGTEPMRSQLTAFVWEQRSMKSTWNYWRRDSTMPQYPDDLDDTACVITGLYLNRPELVTPELLASLTNILQGLEVQPGGPYATWIGVQKREVDIAVNANLAYLLHLLSVTCQPLLDYLDRHIKEDNLNSHYYVGSAIILYFLARGYRGKQLKKLQKIIEQELARAESALDLALLISAARAVGVPLVNSVERLSQLQQADGSWLATALYIDHPFNGQQHYAGSAALTTAFVLEALTPEESSAVSQRLDPGKQMATIVAEATGLQANQQTLDLLNQGSAAGWDAYTLYDDVLDGDAPVADICAANSAMRQSLQAFWRALPDNQDFQEYVIGAFDRMDAANQWELQHARNLAQSPEYGNYQQLADRSWGHTLAGVGPLLAGGYALGGPEVQSFLDFMRNYLIAKQLSDDAHDWRQDYEAGRVTPVVALLATHDSDHFTQAEYYWLQVTPLVNTMIRHHLKKAKAALDACIYFTQPEVLESWIDDIERSCNLVETEAQATQQFIAAYTK